MATKGSTVLFTGIGSDPGPADTAAGLTYSWGIGDGNKATGSIVSHVCKFKGTFKVTLTVTDQHGAKTTTTATIVVS
jgi:PKD repeat protein